MTGKPVDLVAVAVARERLAALAAAHPALFTAEARARLVARALDDPHGDDAMPPKLDQETELIAVRLTADLVAALDAEVERQRRAMPDVAVGRSNVLRGLVRRTLLALPQGAPQGAPQRPRKARAREAGQGEAVAAARAHVEALRATLAPGLIARRAKVSNDTVQKLMRGGMVSAASAAALLRVKADG